jgi:adenosine kinase
MAESRNIGIGPLHEREPLDLVLVGADDPEGMLRHTRECRELGIPFAADPSQQLAFSDGEQIREYIDGAKYLFSNDYEEGLIESKSGWSGEEVRRRVGIKVVTHGNVRVSLSRTTTEADVDRFCAVLPDLVARLREEAGVS